MAPKPLSPLPLRPPLPPPLPRPVPGLWRGTPPAVFPPVLGLLALGLAWRRAGPQLPAGVAGLGEAVLGAATLLALFALVAYAAKVAQRPGVLVEDLRILPGRAGVTAQALIAAGLALHGALLALILRGMWTGPAEGRVITPVWHLMFVGFIVGAMAALQVGWPGLARGIFAVTLPAAVAIWAVSLWQLATRIPPAPLRPLLAIHAAPASLFAIVAADAALPGSAAFAALGSAVALALAASARWLLAAGFSPLWGAFTFPLAALAQALLVQGWAIPGLALLAAATVAVPWIAVRVLRMWAQGSLGPRTNAAVA